MLTLVSLIFVGVDQFVAELRLTAKLSEYPRGRVGVSCAFQIHQKGEGVKVSSLGTTKFGTEHWHFGGCLKSIHKLRPQRWAKLYHEQNQLFMMKKYICKQ